MISVIILMYFLLNSVISIANNPTKSLNQLNINIDYGENNTIILSYNITTRYSYFITFRSFGNEQLKFGVFLSSNNSRENSIEINYQYYTSEVYYLFIICFHFNRSFTDLDIQCEDIRLLKNDQIKSNISQDFLPSYNPLFVPMMYALSVLMLLPVIIQHHRHKTALLLQRRKELRRLSVTISQDKQNPKRNIIQKLLSQILDNGTIPMDIELASIPSIKTILNDIDGNTNVAFTLENLQPLIHKYDENELNEESGINAYDCIAHLLDDTPWNTPDIDQSLIISSSRYPVVHDYTTTRKEQYVPTIVSFHDENDDENDDRKPILKSKKYLTGNFSRTNRTFFESDV